jgi:hypothetical protein
MAKAHVVDPARLGGSLGTILFAWPLRLTNSEAERDVLAFMAFPRAHSV